MGRLVSLGNLAEATQSEFFPHSIEEAGATIQLASQRNAVVVVVVAAACSRLEVSNPISGLASPYVFLS